MDETHSQYKGGDLCSELDRYLYNTTTATENWVGGWLQGGLEKGRYR